MFDKMLGEAQVVITPGSGFGSAGEGYFRISAFNSPRERRGSLPPLESAGGVMHWSAEFILREIFQHSVAIVMRLFNARSGETCSQMSMRWQWNVLRSTHWLLMGLAE